MKTKLNHVLTFAIISLTAATHVPAAVRYADVASLDYFTEIFQTNANDLAFQKFTFTPDGSASFYAVCREVATNFPTDPTGGTRVPVGDDNYVQVALSGGNNVGLYGGKTNVLFIGSNGYVTFNQGDDSLDYSFRNHFRLARISGLLTDLDPGAAGTVSWKQLADRVAVTFQDVTEYDMRNRNNFQIEMFFDGRVQLTYLAVNSLHNLVGLSAGNGVPPGFQASDFSVYRPCIPDPLSISDAVVVEGNAGTTNALFIVSLATNHSEIVSLDFATVDGTATAGNDYVATNGTLIFNPGETLKTVAVPVLGDTLDETNETFFVVLSNPTNISLVVTQATGTIIDDDTTPAPEIGVEQPLNANVADGGSRDFGSVTVGSSSNSLTFTIRNLGTADLTGLGIMVDGPDSSMFTVTANPVAPVVPGGSTTFTIRFTPTSLGAKTATLHIANNDADENPFDISLFGTGTPPTPEIAIEQPLNTGLFDGGRRDFGEVILGSSNSLTFTIRNVGTASLTGLGITVDGPDSSMFTVTANPVAPVVPGGSTTFTIRFTPASLGAKTAALHIANNDPDENPFDISLTGTGSLVTEVWAQYFGPANAYSFQAEGVAIDGSSNVVVTGNYGGDYYTAKYAAADGALLWEKRYDGPASLSDSASAVAVDGAGNVVVTGSSQNGAPNYDGDYYTAKYAAADGALLWEKRYNGPASGYDYANALALDGSGNVVVTGSSQHGAPDNSNDFYTAKYAAADGVLLWEQRSAAMANILDINGARAAAVDGSGNVVVTGISGSDYYTAKYAAANGALLWEKRFNGPANDYDQAKAVVVDGSGNVVVTGYSARFSIDQFVYDYYTAKYAAADGALLWSQRHNGPAVILDRAKGLTVDGVGNVVVTGYSTGEYFAVKYAAADGALLWEKRFDAPNDSRIATAVAVDHSDGVVMTGTIYGARQYAFDYYTVKYAAADGALMWEKRFHGGAVSSLALGPNGMVAVTGHSDGDYATVFYREVLPPVWVSIDRIPAGVRLRFPGVAGHTCQVQRASAGIGPWSTVATPTAATNGILEYIDTNAPLGSTFYRTATVP